MQEMFDGFGSEDGEDTANHADQYLRGGKPTSSITEDSLARYFETLRDLGSSDEERQKALDQALKDLGL